MRRFWALLVLCALAACGGARHHPVIYVPPGPASDPWGPYIEEASGRFEVPQRWIRAVMRQESGGHAVLHGRPITSDAGAAGLMQLMPPTYSELAARYHLGDDPYDPHDNILAGTGYMRELYDRYGAPAFLVAYDAGSRRLDNYNAGRAGLPNETINYLASVAPLLGNDPPMTGPLAVYARRGGRAGPVPQDYARARPGRCVQNPDAAYDPDAPCSAPPAYARPAAGAWAVQVGAFADPEQARRTADSVRTLAPVELGGARTWLGETTPFGGRVLYRARLTGLTERAAAAACRDLAARGQACVTVPPGG